MNPRVVSYEDLECPDCAVYRVMLEQKLLPKYENRVVFEHRDFPLPKHRWAREAAIAARAFNHVRAEAGLAFRAFCMTNLRNITADNFSEHLSVFARSNGIDPLKIREHMADPALGQAVERDYQEGIARGIERTPTVLVNDKRFVEHFTFEQLALAIDAALEETSKP